MIIGYARVSTQDQNSELQVDALEKAGAEQVFQEKFTGNSENDLSCRNAYVCSGRAISSLYGNLIDWPDH